ncbi:MAG: hypothetical protein RBT37_00200 [Dissulfurispiraceae bacterium]|jgi:hypothetical protein|nr:hypothetical protein [Dissulfurispiraceae bacterium]
MKKLTVVVMSLFYLLACSAILYAQEVDYKAGYEKQMKLNADTMAVINTVVQWLKDHKYESYPFAKQTVEDALDQLNYGEEAKKRAESFAKQGNWQQAYGWENQYYQYLIKVATQGLMAKKMVEDVEASAGAK